MAQIPSGVNETLTREEYLRYRAEDKKIIREKRVKSENTKNNAGR